MPKLLDLEGCVVTIDAMGCQKKIVRKIFVEKKAHYVVALKDNQKTLHEEMRMLFEKEEAFRPLRYNAIQGMALTSNWSALPLAVDGSAEEQEGRVGQSGKMPPSVRHFCREYAYGDS